MEFNKLVKFTPEGIKDSNRAKIQKFKIGLHVELQHDVEGFELDDFRLLVNKVKFMEESCVRLKE